jgi:hypothetical protein
VGQVGDAYFTGENTPGVTVVASDAIATWGTLDFGEGPNDDNLERVLASIRHVYGDGPPYDPLQVTLTGLQPGAEYKLQLLFREQCCVRAQDVFVNGELIADDFSAGDVQGGIEAHTYSGAVITHQFTAASTTLDIVMDGTDVSEAYPDHNPILSGLTLERLSPSGGDTDGDGLPDEWEYRYFNNLDQTATDDPDEDGLDNAGELARNTIPIDPDSDKDGLSDGHEVNTTKTDPLNTDSDGDRIPDGVEVDVYGTDPAKADTDGDGHGDYAELRMMTDPLDAASLPRDTTINVFTGGDEGEGLDLDGTFLYAINAANFDPAGPVREAYFTEDAVEGVTLVAGNVQNNWHPNVNFGDTLNDEVLELVMASIRWSDAGSATTPTVNLTFSNLEFGALYKLQLLFAEEAWARGFDIFVNGRLIVDDFAPYIWQGGYTKTSGVVIAHTFVATRTEVTAVLDGRSVTSPEISDRNAILQGATLELIAPNEDTDGDGLPDPWEIEQFGNLEQTASSDLDEDGLTTLEEFTATTDPNNPDSDGDGLNDGAELKTHGTDPLRADTDADGLSDGDEINVHNTSPTQTDTDGDGLSDGFEVLTAGTDPTKTDTDGDGVSDYDELRTLTDPTNPNSKADPFPIAVFTGGDAGEGLDLEGEFIYAIDIGSSVAIGPIRDADFTEDTVEGFTIESSSFAGSWHTPTYMDTAEDQLLALLMSSIRWSDANSETPAVTLTFSNLQVGMEYKLQLLFAEEAWPRGFDVFFNDVQILDDFSPRHYQGGYDPSKGVVVTHTFVATNSAAVVVLDGRGVTSPEMTDHNALVQGATLELIGEGQIPPRVTNIEVGASGVSVTVQTTAGRAYALQYKGSLADESWTELAPVTASGPSTALTDNDAGRLAQPQGFWRVVAK